MFLQQSTKIIGNSQYFDEKYSNARRQHSQQDLNRHNFTQAGRPTTSASNYMRIDEQLRLEKEILERKKKVDMSKNLIAILFKRDREKNKGREKSKTKDDANISARASSPGAQEALNSSGVSDALDEDAYQYFITTFQNHGFDFYIEFSELKFDFKQDFIGGGGYGEVFKA